MIEEKIIYFVEKRIENTDKVLEYVKEYALKNNIDTIVIASTGGATAKRAYEVLGENFKLVIVTHEAWFRKNIKQEFDEKIYNELVSKGVKIVTAAHAFSGVDRAIASKYGGWSQAGLIADILRLFCEGVKVCVEIVIMAADAGVIPIDRDIIAIAGTGRGADTALVIKPATSRRLFSLKIKKILAKPLY